MNQNKDSMKKEARWSLILKVAVFIMLGCTMNMIDNEAVCYGIVLVGVIVFLGKIAMENDANEY